MTPDQLITFAAVAEHRNISRAALALHLSQPAVSGQLRQLQDEFGESLYLRDGRGVRLTPAGEQLASYASRLRDTFRQAYAYRDALRGMEQGTLRIGASTTPASYLLPYLMAEFQRLHPDVTVHTDDGNTADIIGALASFDIALVEGQVGGDLPPDTVVHPWHEDEIVAIMPRSHPLASAGLQHVTLADLGTHALVLREAGSGVRQLIERAFARAGVPMRVALAIAGVEGVKEAVRAGMGVGFVSAMSMRHENESLCRLPLGPDPLTRRFSILVPHASAPSRLVGRFLELCLNGDAPPVAGGSGA
ncbi:LysR family transcriptional regulator [Paraburkholderia phymatum]|uniref:Transcriptional regulator, LysR family n=1 Tax=Paraburkholderia phymatum (strain DSM 17167 / CIP 108236 / LMG 21445 / STM815) TaxID=391038 RepID=B2JHU6_PARP8|nr:LysR family transcriptional regulator [Paraburkholderia phymatum]ACC70438.1 transcriptional regulator, LysR family [Paraburkholderia phymatum STM815]